jgi:hypothetical protein
VTNAQWVDTVLKIIGIFGAGLGFWWGVREWREGQRWKRAERRDTLIAEFEKTPLVRLGAKIIDWRAATVELGERKVVYGSESVRAALRVHWGVAGDVAYPPPQDDLRDAFDALLTFFVKLEHEISTGLVENGPTLQYFAYWLCRLEMMSEHALDGEGDASAAAAAMRAYEEAYSDAAAIRRLYAAAKSVDVYKRLASHSSAAGSARAGRT